jgi:hypothetical protein
MGRGLEIDDRDMLPPAGRKPGNRPPAPAPADPSRSRGAFRNTVDRADPGRRGPEGIPGRERSVDVDRPVSRERHRRLTRDRTCFVSEQDLRTLEEVGKFRAVVAEDLARFHFKEDRSQMNRDVRALSAQGLLRRETVLSGNLEKLRLVTLTPAGKRLLDRERMRDNPVLDKTQAVYSGIRKVAEISHDTAIYRMFQAESMRLRKSGCRVRRVVLDYELKARVFSPLARARQVSKERYRECQESVARENGLRVVDGKIPLPDLRIEYETPDGRLERIDLELTTDDYRESQLREKVRAGFRLYGASRSIGGRVPDERELTRRILPS